MLYINYCPLLPLDRSAPNIAARGPGGACAKPLYPTTTRGAMYSIANLARRLSKVTHFKDLPPSAILEIVSSGEIHHYPKGRLLFCEGEPCSGLYVLFRGSIHLCKISRQGQQSIVGVINPVIMFNEVAVLDGGCNPVTTVVDQPCVVWRISGEKFHDLARRYPVIALSLLPVLAARNRKLLSVCEDVTFRTVMGRTARVLLNASNNGTSIIDRRRHSNQILAAQAATGPEPFCRAVGDLKQRGAIDCTRAVITILDPLSLAHIANGDSACSG